MSLAAVAALIALASPAFPSIEQKDSFHHVEAFRIRADVHGAETPDEGAAIRRDVENQTMEALEANGVPVTEGDAGGPRFDMTADVVIDVHLASNGATTAVAWTFHVSQWVVLHVGALAFASTWEMGSVVQGPSSATSQLLRASLAPGLASFCATYRDGRRQRPARDRAADL